MALLAISGRTGARAVPALLPLMHNNESTIRVIGLHLLASAGGANALEAVEEAVTDKDESVSDEAVRTLSIWPNNWPEDSAVAIPLLALAKSSSKTSHQVLAVRGYLQCLQVNKQFTDDQRLTRLAELLPLIKRPEEKRLVIAAVGAVPKARSLEILSNFALDPDFAQSACLAIVKLAEDSASDLPAHQRLKALQLAVENSTSEATKEQARKLLKAAQ